MNPIGLVCALAIRYVPMGYFIIKRASMTHYKFLNLRTAIFELTGSSEDAGLPITGSSPVPSKDESS